MDALRFLESVRSSKNYHGQIVHIERIPRREAVYGDLAPPLSGEIANALNRLGITRLYCHQAESIEAVRHGESIAVVTSTASGKTLCYNIPVLEALEKDAKARALYIYPTKALAQDQLGKLKQFDLAYLEPAAYDGDTPRQERPFIKRSANVILTNPDMLHVGILPYHTTWSAFFRNLKYVVIDEMHSYRGVFGAHVANILRRLRRVAEYYGSNPQFICASATVRNPGELAKDLIGIDVRVIDTDGSPAGEKIFVFWNPPFLEKTDERRSANSEAVDLFTKLVESHVRTIVFTKARKTAELILRYSRQKLAERNLPEVNRIMSYRAGYRPTERREIERRLFTGELLGVTSTTALEVGVDIGGLDAAIITGYPGTIASTWQQAGRAGRGTDQSLAILIALDNPIDQYLMRNPGYFFSSEHERAIVNSENPYILADHLLCAAYEMPLDNSEIERLFGESAWELLSVLENAGRLSYRRKWFWVGRGYPANNVNIRSASATCYTIVSVERGGMLLGTVDEPAAFETVHPGAVYLHGGDSYVVTKLDIEQRVAYVERTDVNYYTTPGNRTDIEVKQVLKNSSLKGARLTFGEVTVANQVTHYWRKQLFTERVIDKVLLNLPEVTMDTQAVWLVLPAELTDSLVHLGYDLAGSIHAIEHASIGILPLFALCDRTDIGGVSHPGHPDVESKAVIFIYDGYAGGVGLARAAFDRFEELLIATLETIKGCQCKEGCPSCIQSPKCGNNNEPLDKAGAVFILSKILNRTSKTSERDYIRGVHD